MSAWYIFTSLAFYPLSGSSTYLIGSRTFDNMKISINKGQCILSINVHNNSRKNLYVERVLLNGQNLITFPFINHINHLKCLNNDNNQSNIQLDFFMSSTSLFSYD